MSAEIFYDLEAMLSRAFYIARHVGLTQELAEFVQECQRFQSDLLRPWERID